MKNEIEEVKNFPSTINRNVIQSYIFSAMRARLNIYQMRIIYRLVDFAQAEIDGMLIRDNMTRITHNLRHIDLTMSVKSVMPDKDKHYEKVKSALKAMMSTLVEFYNPQSKTWQGTPVIYNVKWEQGSGMITMSVADFVWDAMLNFSYGFRKFELLTAMAMPSANSMRMYCLISGQSRPLEYKIETLKQMFGVADKYSNNSDFIKRILGKCKQELDKVSPWTFNYAPKKEGRAFTSVILFPIEQPNRKDVRLARQALLAQVPSSMLFSEVYKYMRYSMGFEPKEISNNKQLIEDATKELPDMMLFLSTLQGRRRDNEGNMKGKGWVIASIRSELQMTRDKKANDN